MMTEAVDPVRPKMNSRLGIQMALARATPAAGQGGCRARA